MRYCLWCFHLSFMAKLIPSLLCLTGLNFRSLFFSLHKFAQQFVLTVMNLVGQCWTVFWSVYSSSFSSKEFPHSKYMRISPVHENSITQCNTITIIHALHYHDSPERFAGRSRAFWLKGSNLKLSEFCGKLAFLCLFLSETADRIAANWIFVSFYLEVLALYT